jgi:hypothetical protein
MPNDLAPDVKPTVDDFELDEGVKFFLREFDAMMARLDVSMAANQAELDALLLRMTSRPVYRPG